MMIDTEVVPRESDRSPAGKAPLIDPAFADELLSRAQSEGVELLGPYQAAVAGHQGRAGAGIG